MYLGSTVKGKVFRIEDEGEFVTKECATKESLFASKPSIQKLELSIVRISLSSKIATILLPLKKIQK